MEEAHVKTRGKMTRQRELDHPLTYLIYQIARLFVDGFVYHLPSSSSPSQFFHAGLHDPYVPYMPQWHKVVTDLRSICLVCKSWRDIVCPMLWHSISLKRYTSFLTFSTFIFYASSAKRDLDSNISVIPPFSWVRVLTVVLHQNQTPSNLKGQRQNIYDPFNLLAETIESLDNLVVLSITLKFSPRDLEGRDGMQRVLRRLQGKETLLYLRKFEFSSSNWWPARPRQEHDKRFNFPQELAAAICCHPDLVTQTLQTINFRNVLTKTLPPRPLNHYLPNFLQTLELISINIPDDLFSYLFHPQTNGIVELYMTSCTGFRLASIISLVCPNLKAKPKEIPLQILVVDDWDPILSIDLSNQGTVEQTLPSNFQSTFLPILRKATHLRVLKLFSTFATFPMSETLDAISSDQMTTFSLNQPTAITPLALLDHLKSLRFERVADWGMIILPNEIHPSRGAPTWDLLELAKHFQSTDKYISLSFDNGNEFYSASEVVHKLESSGRLISQDLFEIDWAMLERD